MTQAQVDAVLVQADPLVLDPQSAQSAALALRHKLELTDADRAIMAAHGTQLTGHFLIDRRGVIHWVHAEAVVRMADIGRFPSDAEILEAARSLTGRPGR